MHILVITVVGLVVLAACCCGARLLGHTPAGGARLFVGAWLAASLVHGVFGVARAGIAVMNEIGAFIPVFGIPAAIAWFLVARHGAIR